MIPAWAQTIPPQVGIIPAQGGMPPGRNGGEPPGRNGGPQAGMEAREEGGRTSSPPSPLKLVWCVIIPPEGENLP